MGFIHKHRVWAFAAVVLLFLSACSETQPKTQQASSLPFAAPVTFTQPTIRLEGAWEPPVKLGEEVFDSNTDTKTVGPDLVVNQAGEPFISWRTHSEFDVKRLLYKTVKNSVLKYHAGLKTWRRLPQPPIADETVNPPFVDPSTIITFENTSNHFYASWPLNGFMKTAAYQSDQWQVISIDSVGQWNETAVNRFDDAAIFSINNTSFGTSSISASMIMSGVVSANTNVNILQRTGRIERLVASLDQNKKANIVWLEVQSGVVSMWSAVYSVSTQWTNIQQINLPGSIQSSKISNLTLVSNAQNTGADLAFTYHDNSSFSLASSHYSNSQWTSVNTLVTTNTGTAESTPVVNLVANLNGSMAIMWREQQIIAGEIYYQLKSMRFNTASEWSAPRAISQAVPVSIHMRGLKIALSNTGEMSSVWIEGGGGRSDLLVNHFSAADDRWQTPELVVGYYSNESTISAATAAFDDNSGKVYLTWQRKTITALKKELSYWSSSLLGTGTVVSKPLTILAAPTPNVITPSAVWQAPQDVWSDTIFSNTVSLVHGPHMSASDSGSTVLSFYKSTDFDPQTGGYLTQDSVVLTSTAAGVWNREQPFPNTTGTSATEVNVTLAANGDLYALWLVDGSVYFNHFTAGTGWGVESNLGVSDSNQDLMIDASGNVWIFWVSTDTLNLQQYIPGVGLQNSDSTSIPNVWHFASPVIDQAGVINIVWITLSAFSQPKGLGQITYDPAQPINARWGSVGGSADLNNQYSMEQDLTLLVAANSGVVVIVKTTHRNLFSIKLTPANVTNPFEVWGRWENIDYNLDKADHVSRHSNITSNGPDNIMVTWSEETINIDGSLVYRIYSNKYDPVGDVSGAHWPVPERIGQIIPQYDAQGKKISQYQRLPKIALLADGRAFAAWLDSSETSSNLYANQYSPGAGWGATPDLVIGYDRLSSGVIKSPDVALLSSGKALLSWRQEIATEFATEIHAWVAEGQL